MRTKRRRARPGRERSERRRRRAASAGAEHPGRDGLRSASLEAEDVACDLAAKLGSKLTLMHVWAVPTPAYAESITLPLERIQAAAETAMARAAERVRAKCRKLDTILVPGVPWRAIVEKAQEHGFDLVVIGTHGRRGVPRLFLGSVAERVVRAAPVPVLTVHAK